MLLRSLRRRPDFPDLGNESWGLKVEPKEPVQGENPLEQKASEHPIDMAQD